MTITAPTTLLAPATTQADSRPYGRLATALLLGGPAVLAAGRLLLVPLDTDSAAGWEDTLRSMAAHQTRSDTGWLLAILGTGLLGFTAVVLTQRLMAAGRSRSGGFCLLTLIAGWAACAADGGTALVASGMARSGDITVQAEILHSYTSGALKPGVVFLAEVAGAIGYITLAVAAARARIMSRVAAVVLAVGGAATVVTTGGPLTPVLVTAAALLGVGHVLALRTAPATGDHTVA